MLKSPGSSEDPARLADLVRQAIVRVGVLFARGYSDRNRGRLLKALGRAAFDSDLRSELRRQSDIAGFLRDEGL